MRATTFLRLLTLLLITLLVASLTAPAPAEEVTIAYSSPVSLSWAPLEIATLNGYYKDAGLQVKEVRMKGSPLAMAAVLAGNAQFGANSVPSTIQVFEKGEKPLNIALFQNTMTIEIVMSTEEAKERGITAASPLAARVAALKGLRVGISSRGGVPDLFVSYALGSQGLNPERDVTKVPLGTPEANIAALRRGDINAFAHALPNTMVPVVEGFGATLISAPLGDLKALWPFDYGSLHTTVAYAKEHADITRKVAGAVRRANEFIKSHSVDELFPLFQKRFSKTPEKVLRLSVERIIAATSPDGKFSPEGMRNAAKFLLEGKKIKRMLTDEELQSLYSNAYL